MKYAKQRKIALTLVIVIYSIIMVLATLFVPIRATVSYGSASDPDAYTELGYYPIWLIGKQQAETSSTGPASHTQVAVSINLLAWVIQYVVLTAVFGSLYYRTRRHYR